MGYFAHVRKLDNGEWDKPQSLEEHLRETAELAANFASEFNSREWGYVLGLAHDIFKSSPKWQAYLCDKSGYDEEASSETAPHKIEHSAPSAKFVEEIFGKAMGRILSYVIAGHHAGLADWGGEGTPAELEYKLQNAKSEGIDENFKAMLSGMCPKDTPWKFNPNAKNNLLDMSLWIRMLFSCLVDADRLNTEKYMDREKYNERNGYLTILELRKRFNTFMENKTKQPQNLFDEQLYYSRQKVLEDCLKAAEMKEGIFSLSVPTGGGKTLSSMAFALKHAEIYKKKRIIYVIPYTSIIEQNADVFRKVFGNDEIVEHHSNLNEEELSIRSRLAAENWDASIIVTTSVQFFESLFTAKPSRSRKLHNIANSIVILDEAHLIPAEFLKPILETMHLLTEHYKVSFVFCTATQPIFEKLFTDLIVREIIQDVPDLYKKLERVSIEFPEDMSKTLEWKDLAKELSAIEQVLCVVSSRRSCRELFSLMPEGSYHLSALMCAEHRSDIISEITKRLDKKETVRVISTQLVEAGVDIDFPVVYRALAGIDSIVQAAGRCNREGKLNIEGKQGRVVVFKGPRKIPVGILRKASETAEAMILSGVKNLSDRGVYAHYFEELYWKMSNLDAKGIINLLKFELSSTYETRIMFKSASDSFKMIDDSKQCSIFVPYEEGEELIELLKTRKAPERLILRKLQRYTVSIYTNQFSVLQKQGSLVEILPKVFALNNKVEYNAKKGLLIEENPNDPEDFIC